MPPVFPSDMVRTEPAFAGPPFIYAPNHVNASSTCWWKHIVLFFVTLVTTTLVGRHRYLAFLSDFGRVQVDLPTSSALLHGLWYSATILAILGAHEMGHYLACRCYRLDATLPYFLPLSWPADFRSARSARSSGSASRFRPARRCSTSASPARSPDSSCWCRCCSSGCTCREVTVSPPAETLLLIGEPLLFRAVRWLVFGTIPEGSIVNIHPMVFAAWFGMLATALNLLPFGQLDGGHITYATLGDVSTRSRW